MNIFETVYEINQSRPAARAMSMTMDNGERRAYTYGEVFAQVDKYADSLTAAGVTAGDRVAFVSESCPEWTIAFLAACKLHCTAALIDASMAAAELEEFILRSDVRAAFFSPKTAAKFQEIPSFLFPVFNILDASPLAGYRTTVSSDLPETSDKDETIACIIFSSGTTRKAAGIMHCHESLIKTTQMTLREQHLTSEERFLSVLPNSHIYGLICLVLGPALSGAQVHYIESLSAEAVLGAFSEVHPTVLPGVPKLYELFMTQILRKINSKAVTRVMFKTFFPICLKLRRKNGSLLGKKLFKSIHEGFGGSLQFLCSAGAPLSKEVADFYYGTGFNILITYGATETNIPTVGNRPEDIQTDSCGKPYPAVSLKISDSGELLIKSPFMMKGYFRDEEATKAAFTEDGWFMTGDLGSQDENGYVRITGRSKENIVLANGKKMTPDDVEEKYSDLPGVKEFVICGVPHEGADYDDIHAFIVPETTAKERLDAITAAIREKSAQLTQYMRVAKTHFVAEIPRTSLQKPKRYLLKQQALSETQQPAAPLPMPAADESDMLQTVRQVVARVANTDMAEITPDTKIFSELSIDSLSSINLALELEDIYHINIESYYNDAMTVRDVVAALQNKGTKNEVIGQENVDYPQEKTNSDYYAYCFFRNAARFVYKLRIHNFENVPTDTGFILCANHVSKIDYLYIASAFSKARYQKLCCMAKKELFRNDPFSRKLIKSAGMVPVDRSGINMKTMNSLCDKLHEHWGVVIHPEGTRSADGIFREMKSGASVLAIDAGVPIVPVYVKGAYDILPRDRKMLRFFDWKHMKKFKVDVNFGKAILPDGKDVPTLTKEVQDAILALQEKAFQTE
ncbi:MAG: AMP-binding protein [Candidatus Fimenecus sp.]